MNKKFFKTLLKIIVSGGLLSYFLIRSDINLVWGHISCLPVWVFVISICLNLLAILINSIKWQLFLNKKQLVHLFKLTLISQFYNLVLFGQLSGEAVKTYKYYQHSGRASQAVGSVVVERLTAFIGILVLGLIGLLSSTDITVSRLKWIFSVMILVCLLFIILFRHPNFIHWLNSKIPKSRSWEQIHNLVDYCFQLLQNGRRLLLSIFLGILFQIICASVMVVLDNYLGIRLKITDVFWIMSFLAVAIFLPVSIAGIGVREGTLTSLLAIYGISSEQALSLSFILLAIQISGGVIGGILDIKSDEQKT